MPNEQVVPLDSPETETGRRSFFSPSRILGAGAIIAAVANLKAQAPTVSAGDLAILNYALTLEHLEAAFYNLGLRMFSSTDFNNSTAIQAFGASATATPGTPLTEDQEFQSILGGDIYGLLQVIRDHENTHVRYLTKTIKALGGTPVGPCTYNFGITSPDNFLQTAALLENTGVMAYDGAIGQIQAASIKTAGATIATVEARHASYLNLVTGAVPFPSAFDTPADKATILAAAGKFIVSCPAS